MPSSLLLLFQPASGPTQQTLNFADAVTATDAVTKSARKSLADAVTATDGTTKADTKTATDSVGITDQATLKLTMRFADAVTINDSLGDKLTLTKADSVGVTDSISKHATATKADAVAPTDATTKSARTAKADAVAVTDAQTKQATLRAVDAVTATDSLGDHLTLAFHDSVGLVDSSGIEAVLTVEDSVLATDAAAVQLHVPGATHIDMNFADYVIVTDDAALTFDVVPIPTPPTPKPPAPYIRPTWQNTRVSRKKSKDELARLERQAEVIIEHTELPESYPVGAHKAYAAFQDFYGSEDGRRIFIKKALELGRGDTIHEKIADVYKTGAKVHQVKKLETRVQVLGKNGPNVSVSPVRQGGVTILRKG